MRASPRKSVASSNPSPSFGLIAEDQITYQLGQRRATTELPVELSRPENIALLEELLADREFIHLPVERTFQAALSGAMAERMNLSRWKTFTKDASIAQTTEARLTTVDLDLLFIQLCKPTKEMGFDSFALASARIAERMFPEVWNAPLPEVPATAVLVAPPSGHILAVRKLVDTYYLPYTKNVLQPEDDPNNKWSLISTVDNILYAYELPLRRFFRQFRSADSDSPVDNTEEVTYDENGNHYKEIMRHDDFLRFARALNIVPGRTTPFKIAKILKASNHLFPRHYLKKDDEVALVEPEFRDAVVRLAYAMFHGNTGHVTVSDALQAFLDFLEPAYYQMFSRTMSIDLDNRICGIPLVYKMSPTRGPVYGGFDVVFEGEDFCIKRGVFVRFDDVIRRCHTVSRTKATVRAPPLGGPPRDVSVDAQKVGGTVWIQLSRSTSVEVFISNNGRDYRALDPPRNYFQYEIQFDKFFLLAELQDKLEAVHRSYCNHKDPYNTQWMTRQKWRMFRRDFDVSPPQDTTTLHVMDPLTYSDTLFNEFAKMQGSHQQREPVLGLADLVAVLVKYFVTLAGNDNPPIAALQELLDSGTVSLTSGKTRVDAVKVDEFALVKAELEHITVRTTRQFDIYRGPILLGTLTEKPGYISSKIGTKRRHEFLSYVEHDLMGSPVVMQHFQLGESFDHILRRLVADDFQLAGSYDPATRRLVHRAWRLLYGSKQIGAVWEYPGQLTTLAWQPVAGEVEHKRLTVALYCYELDQHVAQAYLLLGQVQELADLRASLELLGYDLDLIIAS
eukprot:TRINITY_DN1383_c0_g1_i1.p1 TRINITY_DN1383_c0_g1~~TRINITY_DN1383_c0_g1_i1.p1  ORF type:complete len:791 (-),score=139.73 TRINITY_DN1383_c0_g1_i1:14-2386(-)